MLAGLFPASLSYGIGAQSSGAMRGSVQMAVAEAPTALFKTEREALEAAWRTSNQEGCIVDEEQSCVTMLSVTPLLSEEGELGGFWLGGPTAFEVPAPVWDDSDALKVPSLSINQNWFDGEALEVPALLNQEALPALAPTPALDPKLLEAFRSAAAKVEDDMKKEMGLEAFQSEVKKLEEEQALAEERRTQLTDTLSSLKPQAPEDPPRLRGMPDGSVKVLFKPPAGCEFVDVHVRVDGREWMSVEAEDGSPVTPPCKQAFTAGTPVVVKGLPAGARYEACFYVKNEFGWSPPSPNSLPIVFGRRWCLVNGQWSKVAKNEKSSVTLGQSNGAWVQPLQGGAPNYSGISDFGSSLLR